MDDLISRQAAIDAVVDDFCYAYCDNCGNEMDEEKCGDCHRKYQNWKASRKAVEKTINKIPSAQPEIVRCKECQYYLYDKIFRQDWCSHASGMSRTRPNDFCSKGVRRDA